MNIRNNPISKCDQAWSDYQQAFIRRAIVEKQDRLLHEWSATHLRLLFFATQEDSCVAELEHYQDERKARRRN